MRRVMLLVSVLFVFLTAVPALANEERDRLALVAGVGSDSGAVGVQWHLSPSWALLPSATFYRLDRQAGDRTRVSVGLSLRRYLGDDDVLRPYVGVRLAVVNDDYRQSEIEGRLEDGRGEIFFGAQARVARRVSIFAHAGLYWTHRSTGHSAQDGNTQGTFTSSVGVAFYLK